ncbi:lipase/acyltransferase domain-containing protein [Reichenbachiella sp.]|uniref:lipase/acyltransferase domain-containing protein n=1 Tax=Reichenbachiella sp. TaxID=2184521 RepID=UPI003B59DD55
MLKNIFTRKRRTLVIGIHGLSNKPPKPVLTQWWRKSIEEGLSKIEGGPTKFDFKMMYWADLLYPTPLSLKAKDPDDPLHIDEPYISEKELKVKTKKGLIQIFKNLIQYIKEIVFLSRIGLNKFRKPFDAIVKIGFRDLDIYYNEEKPKNEQMFEDYFRNKVRSRLIKLLLKNKRKDILIVAHSMGSIITYDVLLSLKHRVKVKCFIAMGSPMGLPLIRENIMKDHHLPFEEGEEAFPPTPEGVENWYSFCDKEDNIGAHYNLADYYTENVRGVKPVGKFVENNYKEWKTDNAHKSFGYLRCIELAEVVNEFLLEGRSSLLAKGKQLFKRKGREQA